MIIIPFQQYGLPPDTPDPENNGMLRPIKSRADTNARCFRWSNTIDKGLQIHWFDNVVMVRKSPIKERQYVDAYAIDFVDGSSITYRPLEGGRLLVLDDDGQAMACEPHELSPGDQVVTYDYSGAGAVDPEDWGLVEVEKLKFIKATMAPKLEWCGGIVLGVKENGVGICVDGILLAP